jgi:tripartite-type tricarboxylate transporter receptor subunit TctC
VRRTGKIEAKTGKIMALEQPVNATARSRHGWRGLAAALVWANVGLSAALAQDFPKNPIRIIVPFAVGGSIDVIARTLQPGLETALGKPVIVENRPGASSQLGTADVARAKPDGYTVLFASDSHVINQVFNKNPTYDAVRDFAPISLLVRFPSVFYAHPSLNVATLQQAIALIKAQPGKLDYGSMGPGTTGHLVMEYLKRRAGLDLGSVTYQGASPLMRALIADEVQFAVLNFAIARPALAAGWTTPLAVTGPKRLAEMPNVPTVAEQGYPDLDVYSWFAAFAPAGTPTPVVERLSAAIAEAMDDPKIRAAFTAQGWEIIASSPRELNRWVRAEVEQWRKFVQGSGLELP